MRPARPVILLKDAAAQGTVGDATELWGSYRTFQAVGSVTDSTGTASVEIQVSNDGENWAVLETINLTLGTTAATEIKASTGAYVYTRASVKTLTGTGAKVSVIAASAPA